MLREESDDSGKAIFEVNQMMMQWDISDAYNVTSLHYEIKHGWVCHFEKQQLKNVLKSEISEHQFTCLMVLY